MNLRACEGKFLVRVSSPTACPEIRNWNLTCRLNLTFGMIFKKRNSWAVTGIWEALVSDRNVQDTTASRNNQLDCPLPSTGSCIPPQIPREPILRPQNVDPGTTKSQAKSCLVIQNPQNFACGACKLHVNFIPYVSARFGGGCRVDHTWKPNNSRKKQSNLNLNPRKFQINVLNTIHKVTLTNNLNTV